MDYPVYKGFGYLLNFTVDDESGNTGWLEVEMDGVFTGIIDFFVWIWNGIAGVFEWVAAGVLKAMSVLGTIIIGLVESIFSDQISILNAEKANYAGNVRGATENAYYSYINTNTISNNQLQQISNALFGPAFYTLLGLLTVVSIALFAISVILLALPFLIPIVAIAIIGLVAVIIGMSLEVSDDEIPEAPTTLPARNTDGVLGFGQQYAQNQAQDNTEKEIVSLVFNFIGISLSAYTLSELGLSTLDISGKRATINTILFTIIGLSLVFLGTALSAVGIVNGIMKGIGIGFNAFALLFGVIAIIYTWINAGNLGLAIGGMIFSGIGVGAAYL